MKPHAPRGVKADPRLPALAGCVRIAPLHDLAKTRSEHGHGHGTEAVMLEDMDLLIGGAGPVGCVIAERAAAVLGWNVLIVYRRSHIAGNRFDTAHANGVRIHQYGPHYFRTND